MLRLVLIGAGQHSRGNHLPALARYAARHPDEVELAALCDLLPDRAEEMAARYGFARTYTDLEQMLDRERPDGCVAITPIPVTVEVSTRVIDAGVPLLMEKPPGATLGEARQLVDRARESGARVMVSMNRRFDPALRAALAWWRDRPIEYLRGAIYRVNRREPEFIYGTAIHPLDAMRSVAGDVCTRGMTAREVEGVWWYLIHLGFCSGAEGALEVLPSAGSMAESYEWFGAGCRAQVRAGGPDAGTVCCWQGGELVLEDEPAQGEPDYVRNGAYGETCAFVAALRGDGPFWPSPADVLQSVALCSEMQQEIADLPPAIDEE
jgi:predicted dehydrogenase